MTDIRVGTWVVAYREFLRFIQERSRMLGAFAMPLLFLVIFGAGFNRMIGPLAPGIDFVQFIYPGIIAMMVLMQSVMSGLSVVWDREFGFLKEIMVAPIGRVGIVLGKAVGAATVAVVQGLIMLVLAPIVGVSLTPLLIVQLVPVLVVVSLSLSGLGILVASRMRSQQGFQLVVQLIIFPLIFLSGVFFPVNNVAPWLATVSRMNPLTYGVDAIRQLFLQGGNEVIGVTISGHTMSVIDDIAVVVCFGAILLTLAGRWFGRLE